MNIFLMVLTCLNIILILGLSFSVFLRVKEKKEDQRITKGLQLLQHKISILQDLSDKTDEQVQRLVFMLDTKSNELRRLTLEANQAVHAVQDTLTQAPVMPDRLKMESGSAPMDEFSQFVKALSLQNENAKPVIPAQDNLPQEFVSAATEAIPPENAVRPFEFRRMSKT